MSSGNVPQSNIDRSGLITRGNIPQSNIDQSVIVSSVIVPQSDLLFFILLFISADNTIALVPYSYKLNQMNVFGVYENTYKKNIPNDLIYSY